MSEAVFEGGQRPSLSETPEVLRTASGISPWVSRARSARGTFPPIGPIDAIRRFGSYLPAICPCFLRLAVEIYISQVE